MKRLIVTLDHLGKWDGGIVFGTKVSFRVIQAGCVLIEDTLSGKVTGPCNRSYEVDAGGEDITVEHNRDDLPWLTISAAFDV